MLDTDLVRRPGGDDRAVDVDSLLVVGVACDSLLIGICTTAEGMSGDSQWSGSIEKCNC